ncbi:MAG: dihydromonapterin reductase [Pseudomonadota bacterium]
MKLLQDVVFITGGGQRIGAFLVKQFLAETNYPVVFTYRTPRPQVDELVASGAVAIQVDFMDTDVLPGLVKSIQARVGSLRGVIHNASLWLPDVMDDNQLQAVKSGSDSFETLFQLHVRTPYFLNSALQPLLEKSTSSLKDIISISDYSVQRASSEQIAYLASKAALQNMCKGFAKKFAPIIKVNDIAPALILFNEGDSEPYKQNRLAQSALGIEPGPIVVWQAIQYLMNSPYTTGTVLPLEGGRSLL